MGESEEKATVASLAGSLGSGIEGIGGANVIVVNEVCLTDGGYDGAEFTEWGWTSRESYD